MIYKKYGNTGKTVSAVGFGGMRFDMEKSLEENADLVAYGASKGITYFDTAPKYCQDKSETIFGMGLAKVKTPWYIATKGMPTDYPTAQAAYDRVRESLDNLQMEKIHFYHVWCIRHMEQMDLALKPGGQYEGLLRAKEEGLIEHIVFSSHQSGGDIAKILNTGKFEGVLLGANILNFPYRWDGVQNAFDNGYGVVAMNPLAGGMIPQNEDKLSFLCADDSVEETPTDAALRFVLSCPQYTVALNGFTTREHVDTACRIADSCKPYSETMLDKIRSHLGENMNAICTGCGYCKGCPKDIPVAAFMQVYNQRQMFNKSDEDMAKYVDGNYKWGLLVGHEESWKECIECGKCEEACTQHLNIIERLGKFADWTLDPEPEKA